MGLVLLLPGCPLSPEKDNGGKGDDTRLDDPTTVQGTLNRLGQVWEQKLYDQYADLLHDGFRFYVLDTDADQFPWLSNDFWGKTEELEFARNMFDPDFSGTNPPVQSIDWEFTILTQRQTTDVDGDTVTEVTTDAFIQVLTGPNDGWRSDTRFVFDVIPDPRNGQLYQVKRQQEVSKF